MKEQQKQQHSNKETDIYLSYMKIDTQVILLSQKVRHNFAMVHIEGHVITYILQCPTEPRQRHALILRIIFCLLDSPPPPSHKGLSKNLPNTTHITSDACNHPNCEQLTDLFKIP